MIQVLASPTALANALTYIFRSAASVMDPLSSSSECIRSPVRASAWSAQGRHMMLHEGAGGAISPACYGIAPGHCSGTCLTVSASRRRDLLGAEPSGSALNWLPPCELCRRGGRRGRGVLAPDEFRPIRPHAMQHGGKLTGSATLVRRMPRRFANSSAQRLCVLSRVTRVSSALAASCKAVHTPASPNFVIEPVTSVSPDW